MTIYFTRRQHCYRKNGWYRKLKICKEIENLNMNGCLYITNDNKYMIFKANKRLYEGKNTIIGFNLICGVYDIKKRKYLTSPTISHGYINEIHDFARIVTAYDETINKRIGFYNRDFEYIFS